MGEIVTKLRDGNTVIQGWTLAVNKDSVSAVLSPAYWRSLPERQGLADGRSMLEAEIDGFSDAVREALRRVFEVEPK